jgi:hypothetical protein
MGRLYRTTLLKGHEASLEIKQAGITKDHNLPYGDEPI